MSTDRQTKIIIGRVNNNNQGNLLELKSSVVHFKVGFSSFNRVKQANVQLTNVITEDWAQLCAYFETEQTLSITIDIGENNGWQSIFKGEIAHLQQQNTLIELVAYSHYRLAINTIRKLSLSRDGTKHDSLIQLLEPFSPKDGDIAKDDEEEENLGRSEGTWDLALNLAHIHSGEVCFIEDQSLIFAKQSKIKLTIQQEEIFKQAYRGKNRLSLELVANKPIQMGQYIELAGNNNKNRGYRVVAMHTCLVNGNEAQTNAAHLTTLELITSEEADK
jgi:hypothetical protein